MAKTLKNRGGGLFTWLFGKRMTSAERRKRSAEIREERLARLPGTRQNLERQQKRRESQMSQNLASPETRKRRRATLPGTAENIARQRAKAAASRPSGSGTRRKSSSK
jgi:hypothetical protein